MITMIGRKTRFCIGANVKLVSDVFENIMLLVSGKRVKGINEVLYVLLT